MFIESPTHSSTHILLSPLGLYFLKMPSWYSFLFIFLKQSSLVKMRNIQFLGRLQHLVHHGGEVNHHHDMVLVCVVIGEQLEQEPEHLGVLSNSLSDTL